MHTIRSGLCRRFWGFQTTFSNRNRNQLNKNQTQRAHSVNYSIAGFWHTAFNWTDEDNEEIEKRKNISTSNRISCELKLLLILQHTAQHRGAEQSRTEQSKASAQPQFSNEKFQVSISFLVESSECLCVILFRFHANGLPFNAIDIVQHLRPLSLPPLHPFCAFYARARPLFK